MDAENVRAALDEMLERLANIEHERWSHWQRYMHSKGKMLTDGSLQISAELVRRWEKQMTTSYAELSETEKESDREQVRKYLDVIIAKLTGHQ